MSILNEEIDRVGQLVNSMADLQPAAAGPGAVVVAKVADEVMRLFRTTGFLPQSVEVALNVQDDARIEGDADMLKQVLVNLVKNAIEALAERGGRIEIASRGLVNRDRKLYVELVVSDNGPGLPGEVLANLFSAVKSTKDGAHHGLGLSIVHSLVKKLHGHVACRSGGLGTAFEILLPAVAAASPGAQPALPARVLGSA
jgi:signal transduction histidine kinase